MPVSLGRIGRTVRWIARRPDGIHVTDVMAAAQRIDDDLPALARMVIQRHLDSGDSATARFLTQPDDREQHQTDWHRWGIITHTRVFLRGLETDVPDYLKRWHLWEPVDRVL